MNFELENPIRTNAIIAAARALNISDADLIAYAFDAIDEQDHHAYDALNDPRLTMILMILSVIGGDDDFDDFNHDLSHALNDLDFCSDHPNTCSYCCDDH